MPSHLETFKNKNLIQLPNPVLNGTLILEVIMGSRAYGCDKKDSDYDIYGVCVPPINYVFPHKAGVILNFGTNPYEFSHFEQQRIFDKTCDKEYSFSIFSVVRFFDLLLGCNPNLIETIFVPQVNISHITTIGHLIRDNRHLFLSKLYVNKMRAYAISQMKKAKNKNPEGKRKELIEKFGYDTKSAMNLLRLAYQTEQVLLEKDLDLQRNAKTLLAIRNGEWPLQKIEDIFNEKNTHIEGLILKSDLIAKPDEEQIKNLLIQCLEVQYGKITKEIVVFADAAKTLKKIHEMTQPYFERTE